MLEKVFQRVLWNKGDECKMLKSHNVMLNSLFMMVHSEQIRK